MAFLHFLQHFFLFQTLGEQFLFVLSPCNTPCFNFLRWLLGSQKSCLSFAFFNHCSRDFHQSLFHTLPCKQLTPCKLSLSRSSAIVIDRSLGMQCPPHRGCRTISVLTCPAPTAPKLPEENGSRGKSLMFPCLGFPTASPGSAGVRVLGKPTHISPALLRAQCLQYEVLPGIHNFAEITSALVHQQSCSQEHPQLSFRLTKLGVFNPFQGTWFVLAGASSEANVRVVLLGLRGGDLGQMVLQRCPGAG